MIKVGMLVHNPPFQGGIVQYCILLVNSMKEYANYKLVGFDKLYPPFFYKGKLPTKDRSGIKFYERSNNFVTWYNPFSWIKAYNQLKDCYIIHLHWVSPLLTPLQYVILVLNKWFTKRKTVLTCHNIEPHESTAVDKIFTRAVFSKIDHFIVHAEQNRRRLISEYGIKSSYVHTVPHGTFGYFTKWKKETKAELRKELGLSNDDQVILFFGYIREYKGLRYLLKAMKDVVKEVPKARLVVAGELWQDLKEYEEDMEGIEKYVRLFPDYVLDKDVHKYFDLADIMVLPYYNTEQTISGPLLVGLAFNKPIIISDVGGIKEVLKNGENALVVEGGNVNQLTHSVIKLLNDKKLQTKLSLGARVADSQFEWENVAKKTVEVYERVLE